MTGEEIDPKEPRQHGRFIDPTVATLSGEAAAQKTKHEVSETLPGPAPRLATDYPSAPGGPTYYDQPVLQTPVWIWSVPAYFYVGGTAGAALVLGWAAQRTNRWMLHDLVRRCRWMGAAGIALGSGFLIYDLGKPQRFLNMLRVFRPSSPLSVGSWLLAVGGPLAGASALLADFKGPLGRLGDAAAEAAALVGVPLTGYTGVVLADTAVPAWQAARRALPIAFIGSAMSGTASLLEMMKLDRRAGRVVFHFGVLSKATELAGIQMIEREASRVDGVGRPFRTGLSGALWKAAKVLSAASLVASLIPGRPRAKHVTAGVLGSAGALCLRFAALQVGRASAADPRATFRQQRPGLAAAPVPRIPPRRELAAPAAGTLTGEAS